MAPNGKLSSTSTKSSDSCSPRVGSMLNVEVPRGFDPEALIVFLLGQSWLKCPISPHTKHWPAASLFARSLSDSFGVLQELCWWLWGVWDLPLCADVPLGGLKSSLVCTAWFVLPSQWNECFGYYESKFILDSFLFPCISSEIFKTLGRYRWFFHTVTCLLLWLIWL